MVQLMLTYTIIVSHYSMATWFLLPFGINGILILLLLFTHTSAAKCMSRILHPRHKRDIRTTFEYRKKAIMLKLR